MDPTSRRLLLSSSIADSDPLFAEDVFSTFLYEGNSGGQGATAQTINNGLDLSGEGGLVWIKNRDKGSSGAWSHYLFDTERGATKWVQSNSDSPENSGFASLSAFNSNGFTLGEMGGTNNNGDKYCSWSFRQAPGFLDIVTYPGTGSVQNISHSLGSTPGMIMIRCLIGTHDWEVYHRSTGPSQSLHLNQNHSATTDTSVWDSTAPTSTQFTVGTSNNVNQNGHTYVAYIFAHDDASFGANKDESIIKCGSFNGTGSTPLEVNLGWEAQYLLVKSTGTDSWFITDNMRGMIDGDGTYLQATYFNAEGPYGVAGATPTGFIFDPGTQLFPSGTFIYMAIRRPHKPPTAGTEVFASQVGRSATNGSTTQNTYTSGFPVDLIMRHTKNADSTRTVIMDRVRGPQYITSHGSSNESSGDFILFDDMDGVYRSAVSANSNLIAHMFKRAAGFMDILSSTGDDATTRNLSHNLGVIPEFIIGINRTGGGHRETYHKDVGPNYSTRLSSDAAPYGPTNTGAWANTTPTASVITVSDTLNYGPVLSGGNANKYIFYLFATLPEVSKVGSYVGNASTQDIDCGFTSGARYVLIKRYNGTGDWYVWDSASGIVSGGNDPYILLNTAGAQATQYNYIDPLSSGFRLTSATNFPALNDDQETYLFLAIA